MRLPTTAEHDHQLRLDQHGQVLAHRRPSHSHVDAQLTERLPVPLVEPIEQTTTSRITERPEHPIVVVHHPRLGNLRVSSQGELEEHEHRRVGERDASADQPAADVEHLKGVRSGSPVAGSGAFAANAGPPFADTGGSRQLGRRNGSVPVADL